MVNIDGISTEKVNKNTLNIDRISIEDQVNMIIKEDKNVLKAVSKVKDQIVRLVKLAYSIAQAGGRVFYIGAGTSGRLGVLDASEILPTFGDDTTFYGIIAGGDKALREPVESIEDSTEEGIKELKRNNFTKNDLLIGLTASGRTPYVVSSLKYAKKLGAKTASIATSLNSEVTSISDIGIESFPGPEVVTGSTRMKSGTFQKLVLNILSTLVMVNKGKVYKNLMVDIVATNKKLESRAVSIIMEVTKVTKDEANELLKMAKWSVKNAIIMKLKNVSLSEAQKLLKNQHSVREIIE